MKPTNVDTSRRKNTNLVCSAINSTLHTIRAPATGARQ